MWFECTQGIARHCNTSELDWDKMKPQMEHIGYPVLSVIKQLTALCKDGPGQWCHWGAITQVSRSAGAGLFLYSSPRPNAEPMPFHKTVDRINKHIGAKGQ